MVGYRQIFEWVSPLEWRDSVMADADAIAIVAVTMCTNLVHINYMPINLDNPFSNIIRGVEANVLWALCEEPHFQTATAIARECGRSRSEVRVVLNYLASTEIVSTFQDGGYKFFKLNTRHPLHKEIIDVSKSFLRQGLPRTAHALDAVNK